MKFPETLEQLRAFVQYEVRNSSNDRLNIGALARQDNIIMSQISDYSLPFVYGQVAFDGDGATTDFDIPHSFGDTPSAWFVTAASVDAKGEHYSEADTTNVTVKYSVAPAAGTGNVIINWMAFVPLV